LRLKFLDKINNMNGKQCLIGLFVFLFGFFGLTKLIQVILNLLNIMHVDYWMTFIGLYMTMVGIFMIIVKIRIIKYDKSNNK
jgi:polyferredoxin